MYIVCRAHYLFKYRTTLHGFWCALSWQACESVKLSNSDCKIKLQHMSKMFHMYKTGEFTNSCDIWLAGVCRYLNEAYCSLATEILKLLTAVRLPPQTPPPFLLPPLPLTVPLTSPSDARAGSLPLSSAGSAAALRIPPPPGTSGSQDACRG